MFYPVVPHPEPISFVQTLRPNSVPSFNAQNNTPSIAHSVGISARPSRVRVRVCSSFPKGLKIFPRSRSVTPLSLSRSAAPLPADQKCARCYLEIPKRRSSFRRVERPRLPCSLSSFAKRIYKFPGANPISSATQILRCQIEFGGCGPPPHVGECGARARYMMFSLLRVRVSSLIAIGGETGKRQARQPPRHRLPSLLPGSP